jgi:hypothetical protein
VVDLPAGIVPACVLICISVFLQEGFLYYNDGNRRVGKAQRAHADHIFKAVGTLRATRLLYPAYDFSFSFSFCRQDACTTITPPLPPII